MGSLLSTTPTQEMEGEIRKYCRDQARWQHCVIHSNSLYAYQSIVQNMFNAQRTNKHCYKIVLKIYTQDVCTMYPHLSTCIWHHYEKVLQHLR